MKHIVIIGAGIVGASCAFHLANERVQVTLIDANKDGRATSAAAGIICPWATKRRNKDWYLLAQKGAAHYEKLIAQLSEDGFHQTGYKKVGAIRLHDNLDNLQELKKITINRREKAPEIGDVSILQPPDVKARFPYITDPFYGLWIEGGARVDGRLLRDAMLQAAQNKGVHIVQGQAALHEKNGIVDGVLVNDQQIHGDTVIAANGVWMNELFSPLGIHFKINAQKGEVIHLQVNENTVDFPVMMPPNNQYMLCFDQGRIIIGASHHHVKQLDTAVTVEGTQYILNEAIRMAPLLKKSSIIETRVGFRPFTFNHLPMFGPIPSLPNVFVANGLGASGLTTGPYIGKQLAALAMEDEADIPIAPYNVKQFL